MSRTKYDYVIVGAGLAGVSAAEGIREIDANGSILLVGDEAHLPYDRPPLSKKLWFGKKTVPEIALHDRAFYDTNGIDLTLGERVVGLDRSAKSVTTDKGRTRGFRKLLIATGGAPPAFSRFRAEPSPTFATTAAWTTFTKSNRRRPRAGRRW